MKICEYISYQLSEEEQSNSLQFHASLYNPSALSLLLVTMVLSSHLPCHNKELFPFSLFLYLTTTTLARKLLNLSLTIRMKLLNPHFSNEKLWWGLLVPYNKRPSFSTVQLFLFYCISERNKTEMKKHG